MRVRVVETGKHRCSGELHHVRSGFAQAHQLRAAGRDHATAADRKVTMGLEAGTPECADAAARKYELCFQARLD